MSKYNVELKFFEDDATREWGVAHSNSINNEYGNSFNAFWNGIGIFHDVFEHYFEDNHPYFKKDYAFNIGGEVAAMGHLSYYWNQYYIEERKLNSNSIYSFEENIISSTESEMEEAITYGYWNFGNKLQCNTPKTNYYHSYLENIIQEHWYKIKKTSPKIDDKYDSEDDLQMRKDYKKSITLGKLRSLYTWGWKEAEKIAPYSEENNETLRNFIITWNKFCKENPAKDLAEMFKYIRFTIEKGENLKWNAQFVSKFNEKFTFSEIYNQQYEFAY